MVGGAGGQMFGARRNPGSAALAPHWLRSAPLSQPGMIGQTGMHHKHNQ